MVAVYDGGAMRIYKDGLEVGSTPKSGPLDTAPGVLAAIGNQPPGAGTKSFDGLIDDVRIYERALPTGEIQGLALRNQRPVAVDDGYVVDQNVTLGFGSTTACRLTAP